MNAYGVAFKAIEAELVELNAKDKLTSLELDRHDLLSVAYEALGDLLNWEVE